MGRNMNGGDLQKYKSRAFTFKAGELTLLVVAEKSPWQASRNAWIVGCGELLGGRTHRKGGEPSGLQQEQRVEQQQEHEEQDEDANQPATLEQPLEGQLNEAQEGIESDGDLVQEHEHDPGQQEDEAAIEAWYEEVGNVLWCQYRVEDEEDSAGQPLVEYEDLLSGEILDLTQHDEPEHYWYW